MIIHYLGHSTVLLEAEKNIIIDPFLTGNPKAAKPTSDLPKIDYVLITHAHDDPDAIAICKRDNATLVSCFEIANDAVSKGVKIVEPMNIGGSIVSEDIRFSMVDARHSSSMGCPAGFVIETEKLTLYHAGDTSLLTDMKLLPDFFTIDVAFLPIGDRFTMGIESAHKAAEWCGAKYVVPIHYDTWPPIEANPNHLKTLLDGTAEVLALMPGQHYNLLAIS